MYLIEYEPLLICLSFILQIITLFSSDSFRVYANCVMFVYIMAVPVYFLIGTIYIYTLMGIWCLASVGVFIIFYLVQVSATLKIYAFPIIHGASNLYQRYSGAPEYQIFLSKYQLLYVGIPVFRRGIQYNIFEYQI